MNAMHLSWFQDEHFIRSAIGPKNAQPVIYFHHLQCSYFRLVTIVKWSTWKDLDLVARNPLMGTISNITKRPARTEGPSSIHRNAMDIQICSGHDHKRWITLVMSLKRWASADIRLTVSPTVDSFLALLDMTRAWKREQESTITTILQWLMAYKLKADMGLVQNFLLTEGHTGNF